MFRKTIAAACALAMLGFAMPALAGGYGHGHHHGHKHYSHRHSGHKGAVFAGGLLLGALIGHLATPRPVYAAPPPVVYAPPPALGNCRTVYGTGYLNGHPARFEGTGCYDAAGNLRVVPGSERFVGYLD